jgi:hypothetical protein
MFQFFPMMQHYTRQAGRPGFFDERAVDPDSPFNPVNHSQDFGLGPMTGDGMPQAPPMAPGGADMDSMNPDEALAHLRMLRARRSYEARFGQHHAGGSAAALAGGEQDMLARVRQAREKGWGG